MFMALIYLSAYHIKANPLSDLDMIHLQVSQRAEIMKIRSWAIKSDLTHIIISIHSLLFCSLQSFVTSYPNVCEMNKIEMLD